MRLRRKTRQLVLRGRRKADNRARIAPRRPSLWSKVGASAQLLAFAATTALALVAYCQIRQAARSAAAMETSNRIVSTLAMHAVEPQYAITRAEEEFDYALAYSESVVGRRRIRIFNRDAHPIRVTSVKCTVTANLKSVSAAINPTHALGRLVPIGDSTDYDIDIKFHAPSGQSTRRALHLCVTARRDDNVRTFYKEQVFELARISGRPLQSTFTNIEYSGILRGYSVQLDPWYEPAVDWWERK